MPPFLFDALLAGKLAFCDGAESRCDWRILHSCRGCARLKWIQRRRAPNTIFSPSLYKSHSQLALSCQTCKGLSHSFYQQVLPTSQAKTLSTCASVTLATDQRPTRLLSPLKQFQLRRHKGRPKMNNQRGTRALHYRPDSISKPEEGPRLKLQIKAYKQDHPELRQRVEDLGGREH